MKDKKTGLVLEGGAMRGLFTAGVLDVLMENHIEVGGLVGVSAGAAFGCNYVSGQPYRVLRYNINFCRDPRYCSIQSLIRTGDLFRADFCYHEIPEKLDPFDFEAFVRSPVEFHVVGTDVGSGKAVYHVCTGRGPVTLEWIRASSSMPMVSRPVTIDDVTMLDGGLSDPIPLQYFCGKGYEKNIVVLTQPRDFQKQRASSMAFVRMKMRRYPGVIRAMERQAELYNRKRKDVFRQEENGTSLVICPEEALPIHRITHDPRKIMDTYQAGRAAAERRMDEIRIFVA